MRFLVTPLLAGALFVCATARAGGQPPPTAGTPAPAPLRWVLPGDTALQAGRVPAGIRRYALTTVRDGVEQPLGTITDELVIDTSGAAPMIRRVQTVRRSTTALVDSSVTDGRTLAPRSHVSQQPARRIALEFARKRVKGSLTPSEAPSLPIDTSLVVAPFDSANWDLLVRSLPLAKDYAVRFPVYDVDAGLREYSVRVTGTATILGEEAHIVRFFFAPNRAATVWFAKGTGVLLQIETVLGETFLLRQELVREEKERS